MPDIALVTGAAGGIGAAIAHRLGQAGLTVVATDLEPALQQAGGSRGAAAVTTPLDVTSSESIAGAVRAATDRGTLQVLVNVAGILRPLGLEELGDEDLDTMLGVNLAGTLRVCRAAAPHLAEGAAIVNVSSIAGQSAGAPGVATYAATKGGIDALTRALACELGPRGVRVNAVAPGFIRAPMAVHVRSIGDDRLARRVPLRRLGEPDDVAKVVAFLCSPAAAYVSGAVVPVDGGVLAA